MSMPSRYRRQLSISIVFVAAIVLSAVAVLSFAQTSFGVVGNTVTIGSNTVQPGQSVSIPVDASVSPDLLAAANIEVDYDPSVVDAVGCTPAAGSCNLNKDHDGLNPDTVAFNFASVSGGTGPVHLADITFQAVGPPGESSALNVRIEVFVDTNGQPIAVEEVDGQIDIPAASTPTATAPPTSTATATPTSTATTTPTPTATATPTPTATATATPTPTATATATPTPVLATPSPTPRPTALPATETPFASPSLTPTPNEGIETPAPTAGQPWGDVDCSGGVSPVDSLKILRSDAGLSVAKAADCPEIGSVQID